MDIHRFTNTQEYAKTATKAIESFLLTQLEKKPVLRVALSGGKSPILVYQELAKSKQIPWSRVMFFLADERYVPLNSNDSNAKMIRENLLNQVPNLRKFYHYNTREPITKLISQYQELLEQQDRPLFNLVILGFGADGHTASLFPHSTALNERKRLVTHTQTPDGQERMSLTFPAILSSEKVIFLICGKSKKQLVDDWLNSNKSIDELPAKGVLDHTNVELFYDMND